MKRPIESSSVLGAADLELIRDILRNRLAADDLLERLNNATNALGVGLGIVIPGLQPACSAAFTRARRIDKLLWAEYEKAAILREQQLSDLPDLPIQQARAALHLIQNGVVRSGQGKIGKALGGGARNHFYKSEFISLICNSKVDEAF